MHRTQLATVAERADLQPDLPYLRPGSGDPDRCVVPGARWLNRTDSDGSESDDAPTLRSAVAGFCRCDDGGPERVPAQRADACEQSVACLHPKALPWNRSQLLPVPGPVAGTRITEAYARLVARDAYFWAWPMVNVYNRRLAFKDLPEPGLMGGIVPVAPLNRLACSATTSSRQERMVACPNQDVVYGAGSIGARSSSPVVIQVPDFGERFWVYQVVDLRTDSFADLGKMYGTKPGFYLLVGPDWKGDAPKGIARCSAPRPTPASSSRASSRTTRRTTSRRSSRSSTSIDMYPLPNSTAR